MDLDRLLAFVTYFFHRHTIALIACLKPKETFRLLALSVVLGTVIYFIFLLGDSMITGKDNKSEMIHQTREKLD